MRLSDMTPTKFIGYQNLYRQAVASVALVDVASGLQLN
jgi:hypothetical protein